MDILENCHEMCLKITLSTATYLYVTFYITKLVDMPHVHPKCICCLFICLDICMPWKMSCRCHSHSAKAVTKQQSLSKCFQSELKQQINVIYTCSLNWVCNFHHPCWIWNGNEKGWTIWYSFFYFQVVLLAHDLGQKLPKICRRAISMYVFHLDIGSTWPYKSAKGYV